MASEMNGYQQAILISAGCYTGASYCVRNADRWYCDAVKDIFGTTIYSQECHGKEDGQWVIKSTKVKPPELADVVDVPGFCRAHIELHGVIDIVLRQYSRTKSEKTKVPRLRIYGKEDALRFIVKNLPVGDKKIQRITNRIGTGYTGSTCAVYYQSRKEVGAILEYISGEPCNTAIWNVWKERLSGLDDQ